MYQKQLRRIVRVQCLWRVKTARRVYRKLRAEARSVDNMKVAFQMALLNTVMHSVINAKRQNITKKWELPILSMTLFVTVFRQTAGVFKSLLLILSCY